MCAQNELETSSKASKSAAPGLRCCSFSFLGFLGYSRALYCSLVPLKDCVSFFLLPSASLVWCSKRAECTKEPTNWQPRLAIVRSSHSHYHVTVPRTIVSDWFFIDSHTQAHCHRTHAHPLPSTPRASAPVDMRVDSHQATRAPFWT